MTPHQSGNLFFCVIMIIDFITQAQRIQDVLDTDDTALFGMLEVGENLTYANNTVMLSNGTSFEDITCLTVENRIQTKTLSGSSTGYYGGFGKLMSMIKYLTCTIENFSAAQIAVSFQLQKVVMVQFGVRPIVSLPHRISFLVVDCKRK